MAATGLPDQYRDDVESVKVPPHSLEAEQAVLGGLMLDNAAWDQVADRVSEQDFYRADHRLIFGAIAALAERNDPFDAVTVSERLERTDSLAKAGGLAYLATLAQDTPSAANIRAYADIVRERSMLRQLIAIGGEIADSAFRSEGRTASELVENAEQRVFEIADRGSRGRRSFLPLKQLLTRAVDRMDELFHSDDHITGVSTGFDQLDEMTSGLQKGDLIIIAGRPSMGKTSLAICMAEHAAIKGKVPTAVFSMEMPAEQLAMRLISSLGRVNQAKLRNGSFTDDDWPRISSAVTILSDAPIFIDDSPGLTPTELRARARRLKREHGLGLIVVDYLQLMQVPGTKENRATEISEISRGLKALAKELECPVIALSQLNRSVEQRNDKRPVMSDLRECVTGDTLVVLADGRRVPIAGLVGQTPDVIAVENDKLVEARSDRVWCVGKKPVLEIALASGRRIRATEKHRLFGADGWRRVADLAVGDRLAIAHRLPEPASTKRWADDHVALLGHLIGDGRYLSGQPMRYTTASEENSELVTRAATAFGCTVRRYRGRGKWHQLLISGNGNRWKPAGVNAWLRELGVFGQRSHEKRIPEAAFQLPNDQVALLLQHLWATDGCISLRAAGQRGAHRVFFATCSRGLADDVAALLLRLGIVARIRTTHAGKTNPLHSVDVTGAEAQALFLERVGAFGPRVAPAKKLAAALAQIGANPNVDTLPQEWFVDVKAAMAASGVTHRQMASMRGTSYGGSAHFKFAPSRTVFRQYAELLNDDELRRRCESDYFWDRIVAITPAGEQDVYDLTVPGPASWLADGIVSHNSGAIEQDADLIAFIYRDEVYDKETRRKGIADIIVAKQRNGPIGEVQLTFLGEYTRFENLVPEAAYGDYPPDYER